MDLTTNRWTSAIRAILASMALLTVGIAGAAERTIAATDLVEADLRLARIAWRLQTANAPICADRAPITGLVLQAIDQWQPEAREAARAAFGFPTLVVVEAVVPGSAADRAGVRANDGLASVAGETLPRAEATGASARTRDIAATLIERQPGDAPLTLTLVRDGTRRTVKVPPAPGCKSRVELILGPDLKAEADGSVVQIGVLNLERFSDDAIAVTLAHEIAHNILRHRARLDAAKVNRGLFGEVGRSGRLFRETEDAADLLSVHLLRNAGYDPRIAVTFWLGDGDRIDGGLFRSRTHAGAKSRARAIEAEIAAIPESAAIPYAPAILATRDEPLK